MKIYEANEIMNGVLEMLESDYSDDQWIKKEYIDEMRYTEAEKALDKIKRFIDIDAIEYDEDDWEERERLNYLMYTVERKLEEM